MATEPSAFIKAMLNDTSLPIDEPAKRLWAKDLQNPLRWVVRPLLQFFFAMLLHIVWLVKRLPLIGQLKNHRLLQRLICWFSKHFVSPEANQLILRHFSTESNILNFLLDNGDHDDVPRVNLYPKTIDDMIRDSFVEHDQELFRIFASAQLKPKRLDQLKWQHWQVVEQAFDLPTRKTQVIDFETAHTLFMCLFCALLTKEEYRDAINGFSLDHSIAIQVAKMVGDPTVIEFAYNKYPQYLVGPWNLTQRFIMHGFFTEYLYAYLEALRQRNTTP